MDIDSVGTICKDLIQYLCNLGYSSNTSYDVKNIFIQVKDNKGEVYLQFRLEYYRDACGDFDYNNLQIAWKIPKLTTFMAPHKFPKNMDQKVIFDIILFEITSWKLQHLDELIAKTISKTLDSDVITNWLKTKEEQIRIEERAKIEDHLSIEEFRKVIGEELNKVKISFKIGD